MSKGQSPNSSSAQARPAAVAVTAAHLRRTLGPGGLGVGVPSSRPSSLYGGDLGRNTTAAMSGYATAAGDPAQIGFSSNPTPPLGSAIDADTPALANLGGNPNQSRLMHGGGSALGRSFSHPRSSCSDECTGYESTAATSPPPALPAELLDALDRDPAEHKAFMASQNAAKSMPTSLPTLYVTPFIEL